MPNTITCNMCKLTKPPMGFVKHAKSKTGYRKYCKDCHNKNSKTYRTGDPDKIKDQKLRQTLGVTLDQKKALITKQRNKCPICKLDLNDVKFTPVDHCHKTGKIRGVLCGNCNVGLGHFRDSLKTLFRAAIYLIRNKF